MPDVVVSWLSASIRGRSAAHYLVVAGHHAAGDDHAARRALERYHDRLHELGINPATDTGMLQRLAGQLEHADPRRL